MPLPAPVVHFAAAVEPGATQQDCQRCGVFLQELPGTGAWREGSPVVVVGSHQTCVFEGVTPAILAECGPPAVTG